MFAHETDRVAVNRGGQSLAAGRPHASLTEFVNDCCRHATRAVVSVGLQPVWEQTMKPGVVILLTVAFAGIHGCGDNGTTGSGSAGGGDGGGVANADAGVAGSDGGIAG